MILNIRSIYDAIGQDPEVADLATQYVTTLYPFHFFEMAGIVYNECYAVNCRVTHYMMIKMAVGTISHAIMAYVFCVVYGWGFTGICWASGLMFLLRGVTSLICVKCGDKIPVFDDVYLFSKETVSNLSAILKLDLKSCAMGVWGWWAFDIYTLMASYLGTDEVGA